MTGTKRPTRARPAPRNDDGEESKRLIFELSPHGMLVHGIDGAIEMANPAAARILGLSSDDLIGRTPYDGRWQTIREDGSPLAPEERPAMIAQRTGEAAGPMVLGVRVPELGLFRWLDISAVPLKRGDGTPSGRVLVAFSDITSLKQADIVVRENHRLLNRAEALGHLGHYLFDVRTGTVRASEGAKRIYGMSGDSFSWQMLQSVVIPEDRERLERLLPEYIASGRQVDESYRIRRATDGAEREVRVVAEFDVPQQMFFGVITDCTESRHTEAELRRQTAFARSIFDADDAALAVVSPEGKIVEVNAAWKRFVAKIGGPALLAGASGLDYLTACEAAGESPQLKAALGGISAVRAGTSPKFEMTYPCHTPERERWLTMRVLPVAGEPGMLLVAHRDETERFQIESALRASETRFRLLSEHVTDVIWILDVRTGRFEFCSPSLHRITGYSVQELMAGTYATVLGPEERARVIQLIAERVPRARDDDPSTLEYVLELDMLHKDGHRVPVEMNTRLLKADDGSFTRVLGVSRDVSERRRAEAALRLSEEFFEKAFRLSPMIMTLSDVSSGVFIDVNDAFCAASGWSIDECLGRTPWELGWTKRPMPDDLLRTLLQDGAFINQEMPVFSRQGEMLTFLVSGERVELRGRHLFLLCGVNITGLRHAEAQRAVLEAQVRQLERMESLGRLAGGVAHDLNNVLTSILTLAELQFAEAPAGSELAGDLDAIAISCLRGQSTVRGLLDFARADVAKVERVDLNAVIRDEIALLSRTTLKKAKLVCELEPELPLVHGDKAALTHVFMNLCLNAVDAMPHGGTATVRTKRGDDGWIVAEVSDTGTGMPPEVLGKALDPFFTTKPQGAGTGLGLSIVYSTVKAHRGTVALMSEPGLGTTVTIRLPAAGSV